MKDPRQRLVACSLRCLLGVHTITIRINESIFVLMPGIIGLSSWVPVPCAGHAGVALRKRELRVFVCRVAAPGTSVQSAAKDLTRTSSHTELC
jgi:hypothetical protein